MGRIVINETENKQTVILNDSPEGVSGGYFDDEMVWHELGGEGGPLYPLDTDFHHFTTPGSMCLAVDKNLVVYTHESAGNVNQDCYALLVPFSANGTGAGASNVNTTTDTIYRFSEGDVVRFKVNVIEKVDAVSDLGQNDFTVGFRYRDTSVGISTGSLTASDDVSVTVDSDKEASCMILFANNNIKYLMFEIEIYVNGERWV